MLATATGEFARDYAATSAQLRPSFIATRGAPPRTERNRLRMTLVRPDDTWLVERVESLENRAGPSTGRPGA